MRSRKARKAPPEVLEFREELKRMWWSTAWSGLGKKSSMRDVLRVLIELAERYGQRSSPRGALG